MNQRKMNVTSKIGGSKLGRLMDSYGKRTFFVFLALLFTMTLVVWTSYSTFAAPYRPPAALLGQVADNQEGVLAVVGAGGAELYDAPAGEILQQLSIGTTLNAVGRSEDNLWVFVYGDNGVAGWTPTAQLVLFGVEGLPVLIEQVEPAEPADAAADDGAVSDETEATIAPSTAAPTPTSPPTATPTATVTSPPTDTPTPVPPSPTPTLTSIATQPSGVIAVVGARGAMLWDAPDGNPLQMLPIGTPLTVVARTDDAQWMYVNTRTGLTGWVEVGQIAVFQIDEVPVVRVDTAGMPGAEMNSAAEDVTTDEEQVEMTDAANVGSVANATTPTSASPSTPVPTRPTQIMDSDDITATVILDDSRLNVRSGPGTEYAIVAKVYPDEILFVRGRDESAGWIQIDLSGTSSSGPGWVSADYVTLSAPLIDVPTVEQSSSSPMPTSNQQLPVTVSPADDIVTAPTGLSGTLVFQTLKGDIYVYDLDGANLRRLTDGYEPDISRDGTKVAFVRYGGNQAGIWTINTDGSDERFVFGEREFLTSPKWSPDGNWIVFSRGAGSYSCHNLGFGMCVSEGRFCPEVFPNCLPDELKVKRPNYALSRIDSNGESYQDIVALNSARAPDWHENGIVYDASTGLEITQDAPGAETRKVIAERYYHDADWQPDGDRIIFQSREGSHWEIFTIDPDGRGLAALTRPATTLVKSLPSNTSAAWSPDGKHIVYLSSRDENNDEGDWRIWVMNADGTNQRPLPIDVEIEYGFAHEQMVGWGR